MHHGNGSESGWAVFGKVIGVLCAIAAVIGLLYWVGSFIYYQGYDTAKIEARDEAAGLEQAHTQALEAKDQANLNVGLSNHLAHSLILSCLQDEAC